MVNVANLRDKVNKLIAGFGNNYTIDLLEPGVVPTDHGQHYSWGLEISLNYKGVNVADISFDNHAVTLVDIAIEDIEEHNEVLKILETIKAVIKGVMNELTNT